MITATLFHVDETDALVRDAHKQRKLVLSLFGGAATSSPFPTTVADLTSLRQQHENVHVNASLKKEVGYAARWLGTEPPKPVTVAWLHQGFLRETRTGSDKELIARFSQTWDAAKFQDNIIRSRKKNRQETYLAIAHDDDGVYLASVAVWFNTDSRQNVAVNMVGIFARLAVQMASGAPGRPRNLASAIIDAITAKATERAALQFCVFRPRPNMKAILRENGFKSVPNGFMVKLLMQDRDIIPELCDESVVD
jgi:hypothetical protein